MTRAYRRAKERVNFTVPITHSMYNRLDHTNKIVHGYFDNHHEGTMKNINRDGIYFETNVPCRVLSTIHINIPDNVSRLEWAGVTKTDTAKVIWCKKIKNAKHPGYEVGAKFLD